MLVEEREGEHAGEEHEDRHDGRVQGWLTRGPGIGPVERGDAGGAHFNPAVGGATPLGNLQGLDWFFASKLDFRCQPTHAEQHGAQLNHVHQENAPAK
jgi:hypothetical protein